MAKDIIINSEYQATKTTFINNTSDRRLMYNICKKLKNLDIKKAKIQLKMEYNLNRVLKKGMKKG